MQKLKSYVLFDSEHKNKYLFDRNVKRTHLCHPVFVQLVKAIEKGIDVGKWLEGNAPTPPGELFRDIGKEEIRYYYQKYRLLEDNGYFTQIDQQEIIGGRLTGEHIKESLANSTWVIFEVTDNCNLNCHYCGYGKFYSDHDARENVNMDFQAAKQLLDHLLVHWNSSLNHSHDKPIYLSFYGGEPLLNFPLIEKIVNYSKKLNVRHNIFKFAMTTNAVLLHKYMDYLVENRFRLLISLDGNRENNDYRVFKNGNSSFDIVLKNVKLLRQKHPRYFEKQVNFNAVLHNKNSVDAAYRYIKKEFDKIPGIAELNNTGIREALKEDFRQTYRNLEESLHETEDYSLVEKDLFLKIPNIKSTSFFVLRHNDFCYRDYDHLLYPFIKSKRIPTATCMPFSLRVFMTVNGKLLSCERIGHRFSLGQVTPEKVELDYDGIAGQFNAWYDKMQQICNSCYNADNCSQCMFYLNLDTPVPDCKGLMDYDHYTRYVSSFISYLEENPENYNKILREAGNG